MDGTVAFDHKVSFAAIEVRNVSPELMLPPEFESKDLSIPKQLPQELFGRRLFFFGTREREFSVPRIENHRDIVCVFSSGRDYRTLGK